MDTSEFKVKGMDISELKVEAPYDSLFLINQPLLDLMKKNMEKNNYDESRPITIWKGRNIVIDGHIRLQAAKDIGLTRIPVVEMDFKDEDDARGYAIRNQFIRRDLDDANILHLVELFDKNYQRGGDRKSKFGNQNFDNQDNDPDETESEREADKRLDARQERKELADLKKKLSSRNETADKLKISADKVSQCRHILKHCSPSEISAVKEGRKTIHQVCKSSLAARKKQEKELEEQETKVKKHMELKTGDFPSSWKKKDINRHAEIIAKLDILIDKVFPNLEKGSSDMFKLLKIVEFFKEDDGDFKIFCGKIQIRQFLGSLLVTDFIEMLRCFGYKIETPTALNVPKEERPVKKKRPAPKPHCNIGRVHRPDFISNADRRAMEQRIEDSMDWQNMQSGS